MKKEKRRPKCPKTGKTQYATQAEAKKGIVFIWSRDSSVQMDELEIYTCPDCRALHIRHKRRNGQWEIPSITSKQ